MWVIVRRAQRRTHLVGSLVSALRNRPDRNNAPRCSVAKKPRRNPTSARHRRLSLTFSALAFTHASTALIPAGIPKLRRAGFHVVRVSAGARAS